MTVSLESLRQLQGSSVGFLLIRCGQLWNERGIAAVNAEAGKPVLRDAHTRLLPLLVREDGVRIVDLAQRLKVTKQAVQPLVAEMEKAGLVRIEDDREDRRARRVFLTAHGVTAMKHGTGVLVGIEQALKPALGARDLKALGLLLRKLLAVLEGPAPARRAPRRR